MPTDALHLRDSLQVPSHAGRSVNLCWPREIGEWLQCHDYVQLVPSLRNTKIMRREPRR